MAPSHTFLRGKFRILSWLCLCLGIACSFSKVLLAQTDSPSEITIQINGQTTTVDPPAKLEKGAVLVPLRGVLEKLDAKVSYNAAKQQIIVNQGGRTFLLGINLPTATLNQIEIPLSAAPKVEKGSTFVPLRSLAELFGYQVKWQGTSKTVQINSVASINHLTELNRLGHFGVAIDVTNIVGATDANALLDAAKKSGASFIKIRFDWSMLEPTEKDTFAWDTFDQLVRGATDRGMGVVGVLGDSTQWASIYQETADINQWRAAPPAEKYFPAWDNYVRRVVGRYRKDVHAWQIWEYPASYNFRSGAVDYRNIVRRGAVMASLADPGAIVFAGEPGGINLGFLHDLKNNGITSATAGVMLHPVSQWQPGVIAQPSAFLLPFSTLRNNKSEMYWADALSFPVLSESSPLKTIFYTQDAKLLARLKSTFTPQAQADYLVKTDALALAAGISKTIWGALRDEFSYPKVDPVNPDTNSGLLASDLQPRPAYEAFVNINKLLGKSTYVGTLAKGPDAVVLLFSDGSQNTAVAWSLDQVKSTLFLQEIPPATPAATPVAGSPISIPTSPNEMTLKTTGKSQV
ncbi:MAG: copper amine oxidase N-terminal domain-containing protein, partial [Abditibacteriaceae bacterium]